MEIVCYGWRRNYLGEWETNPPIQSHRVSVTAEGLISCVECDGSCIFGVANFRAGCPGVRKSDGDWRFSWTVRKAKRINGKISCSLMSSEEPCLLCLLTLRK